MNLMLSSIQTFANSCLDQAAQAAKNITFSEEVMRYSAKAASLSAVPKFESLPTYFGEARWVTVLFVDLRGSTQRAVEHGPKSTYITMHALLPTLAKILTEAGGKVCNFRGDGLFGIFGVDNEGTNPDDLKTSAGSIVLESTQCARAMIQAVDEAIKPALASREIDNDLRIGIGIDKGEVVITRIGLDDINELTVYGSPVNKAAKLSGENGAIIISPSAEQIFPRVNGGKLTLKPYHKGRPQDGTPPDGFRLIVPQGLKVLK